MCKALTRVQVREGGSWPEDHQSPEALVFNSGGSNRDWQPLYAVQGRSKPEE